MRLIKTYGLLFAFFCCLTAANCMDMSGENVPHPDGQKLTVQAENTHQIPFASLASSLEGLFSEPDSNNRHSFEHYFFSAAHHPVDFSTASVDRVQVIRKFFHRVSIYLLDSILLI